jgi:hypothetical protein
MLNKFRKDKAIPIVLKVGGILLIPWLPLMSLYIGILAYPNLLKLIVFPAFCSILLWFCIYKESKLLIIIGLTFCSIEFVGSIIFFFYWIINYVL